MKTCQTVRFEAADGRGVEAGEADALRDAISARFGVKRIGGFSGGLLKVSQVGGHLDFFLIERLVDTMMTLTARDRHLDVMI
jgi:hypothetical protein